MSALIRLGELFAERDRHAAEVARIDAAIMSVGNDYSASKGHRTPLTPARLRQIIEEADLMPVAQAAE